MEPSRFVRLSQHAAAPVQPFYPRKPIFGLAGAGGGVINSLIAAMIASMASSWSAYNQGHGGLAMFRFMIRDMLWLTVVAALAVGWWTEFRARHEADGRCNASRQAMQQTAKLLMASIIEKDGEVVAFDGARYVPCPECDSTLYLNPQPVRSGTHDMKGNSVYCWRLTGKCVGCSKQFSYVLMPDDVPGYMTWTPRPEP
jgi:hypothetical protein